MIDLNKKYPGYFKKIVFRTSIIIMLLMLVVVFVSNGYTLRFVYAECSKDSFLKCPNPFYVCPEKESVESFNINLNYTGENDNCIFKETINKHKLNMVCEGGGCDLKYLSPGQSIGQKPNFLAKKFNSLVFLIVLLAFGVNHIIYKWKVKK